MKIKVIVLRPSRRFELDITLEMSVLDLKSSINEKVEDVEVTRMKLIIQGRVMVDGKQLGDYTAMREGVAIHMVVVPTTSTQAPAPTSSTEPGIPRSNTNIGAGNGSNFISSSATSLPEVWHNLPASSGMSVQQTPMHILPDGSRMMGFSVDLTAFPDRSGLISNPAGLPSNMNELVGNALRAAIGGAANGSTTFSSSTTNSIPTTTRRTTTTNTANTGGSGSNAAGTNTSSDAGGDEFSDILNELGSSFGLNNSSRSSSNSNRNSHTREGTQLSENPRPTRRRRLISPYADTSLDQVAGLFDGARRSATNYNSGGAPRSSAVPPSELPRLASFVESLPRELRNMDYHINLASHNLNNEAILTGDDRTRAQESIETLRQVIRSYAISMNAMGAVLDRVEFGSEPGNGVLRHFPRSNRSGDSLANPIAQPFSFSNILRRTSMSDFNLPVGGSSTTSANNTTASNTTNSSNGDGNRNSGNRS